MHEVLILWHYRTYMLFWCDGYNFIKVRIYIYIYICMYACMQSDIIFSRKVWVWMQESGKVGVIFSSLASHVSHPSLSTSLIFFGYPKSQFALSFFCCIWSPAAHFSSFSTHFSSFFVLLSSSLLTRQHLSLPFSPKILVSLKKKLNN